MAKKIDLTGRKFGRLFVLEEGARKSNILHWKCKCDCGNVVNVSGYNLKNGKQKSCGCLRREKHLKHGKCKTPEYTAWEGIIDRCFNKNNLRYHKYGGRGITVCDRWLKFENFYEDMGQRPSKDYSLDRVNNNGNYDPLNCRWATREQQQRNTSAKGYSWDKERQRWAARIHLGTACFQLGRFNTETEARNAYLEAKKYYHNDNDAQHEIIHRLHACWSRFGESRAL